MLSSVQIFSLVLCLGLACIFLGITLYAIVLAICKLAPAWVLFDGGALLTKVKNLAVALMAGGVVIDSLLFVVVCLYEVFNILGG